MSMAVERSLRLLNDHARWSCGIGGVVIAVGVLRGAEQPLLCAGTILLNDIYITIK